MGHAKRKRNRKRQEREREQEQQATQTAQINEEVWLKDAAAKEKQQQQQRLLNEQRESYELSKNNPKLNKAYKEALYPVNYVDCYKDFLSLEKHRNEYGFLPEFDQIRRDLLEMTITNDVWGVEREVFLGVNREKTRKMGRRLNELGGYRLMLGVLTDMYKGDQRELEVAWDGIGGWKA